LSRVGRQQFSTKLPATTESVFDETRTGGHAAGVIELVLKISVDPAVEAAFDASKSLQRYLPSRRVSMTMPVRVTRTSVCIGREPTAEQ
jgi:hypothetical protein